MREINSEAIEALVMAFDDLKKCSLLVVDKKIKRLLRCIAYYDDIKNTVRECSEATSYVALKKKAMHEVQGRNIFSLPVGDNECVVFTLNLLVEFDNNTIDLLQFLKIYFPAENEQKSFRKFYEEVLIPFSNKLCRVIVEGVTKPVEQDSREIDFVNEGIRQQLAYYVDKLTQNLRETTRLGKVSRNEYTRMMEGFTIAMETRDTKLIKAMWTAIRRCLAYDGLFEKLVGQIDEVLKLYMVI